MLPEDYWYSFAAAMSYANGMAAASGVRYRVQLAHWRPSVACRWHVGPTPALAPGQVGEPCS